MRGYLLGVALLVLVCWQLAARDGHSQFPPGKAKGSPEEKLFKDVQKTLEKLAKLGPDDEDKANRELQKFHDKVTRPRPSEDEQLFKDMKKAIDQAFRRPADDEEKLLKELKKQIEQTMRAGASEAETEHLLNAGDDVLFGWLDQNGDGVLNRDELSETLRSQLAAWDRNGDGLLSEAEYRSSRQARLGVLRGAVPESPPDVSGGRPVVYRVGKLPTDLPAWFAEYDTDEDGQVCLYEWRTSSGRPLADFQAVDRNGDGFVTIAEALHWQTAAWERFARQRDSDRAGGAEDFLAADARAPVKKGGKPDKKSKAGQQ